MKADTAKKTVSILVFIAVWTAITILAVTWRVRVDWPDNVHVDYGFPLTWATHTVSTIAGPADIWQISLSALTINLLFWLGLMVVAVAVLLHIFNKKS